MSTRIMLPALAAATLTLTACGKAESVTQRGDKVVRDWIAATVNKDGKTYCGLMTPRLLQSTTGRSDGAEKTCERQIKAGTGEYPFQFEIPKPTTGKAGAAEVSASGKKLRGRLTLKEQKGELLIDAVR
ncbi:MAG: hypothetical protein M3406_03325 [Chloroflexota bacterium]|nr:hypothetical protein [Chloroflexota bacterium]